MNKTIKYKITFFFTKKIQYFGKRLDISNPRNNKLYKMKIEILNFLAMTSKIELVFSFKNNLNLIKTLKTSLLPSV